MDVINSIMAFILSILDSVLPSLGFDDSFLSLLDSAFTTIISLLETANYFLPLDVMVVCFSAMLVVDNFALLMRIGQWFIRTLRG